MEDEHRWRIDEPRARAAYAAAIKAGRALCWAQRFELGPRASGSISALSLYGAACHEPADSEAAHASEFFWADSTRQLVGFGCVSKPEVIASFKALEALRQRLNDECADNETRDLIKLVGGLAFDPQASTSSPSSSSESPWGGYGPGRFWTPSALCARRADERTWRVTLAARIDPSRPFEAFHEALRGELTYALTWIGAARAYDIQLERRGAPCSSEIALEEPRREAWGDEVERVAALMRRPEATLQKVVLARRIHLALPRRVRPAPVLAALVRDHPDCAVFALRPICRPEGTGGAAAPRFIGATPERLLAAEQGAFRIDALAGSAPLEMPDEALLESAKNRLEHRLVLEAILSAVQRERELDVGTTHVHALRHIKHLRTVISGRASQPGAVTRIAGALHPTPAVCGTPRSSALAYLREREQGVFLERGWYTGALGWLSLDEESGAFYVALRCALLSAYEATLFVGAGIVPGSEALSELEETSNKSSAISSALLDSAQGAM